MVIKLAVANLNYNHVVQNGRLFQSQKNHSRKIKFVDIELLYWSLSIYTLDY
ncbi:hypothetical protein FQR65_LT08740 [Abscondita terminalis]|nr:hypothetical protein FQR65_LT08740 [Abscondita terminalis]